MAEKAKMTRPLRGVVWACGLNALYGVLIVATAIAVIGWAIENHAIPRSWSWLLWAASAGGHSTWFAISGTFAATGVFAWGACVHAKTGGALPSAPMVAGGLVCSAVYLVFLCATNSTIYSLQDLSAYAVCGVIAAHVPIAIIGCGLAVLVMEAIMGR